MSEGLIRLKEIGAQKIHEQTHIARHHAQAILHESFEDITKIQFAGFVSIIEREYGLDLEELRLIANEYYDGEDFNSKDSINVFVVPEKKKSYTLIYLAIASLVFVGAIFLTINNSSSNTNIEHINEEAIENAKVNIKISDSKLVEEVVEAIEVVDENTTLDENLTQNEQNATILEIPKAVVVVKSLKLIASKKLWLGYMNLETRNKKQKIFSGELDLDPKKDWLLSLGHGYVDVEIDGKITKFKSRTNIKLLYQDSNITKINIASYKKLNRGMKW